MIQVNKPKSVCNNLKRNIYYKITNTSENYQNCKVHKYSKESKFVTIVIIFIKDKIEMISPFQIDVLLCSLCFLY